MLNQYLTQTAQLLQNPGAPTTLYSTSDLTGWINTARGQLAGEAECIRTMQQLTLSVGSQGPYAFPTVATPGILEISNVRLGWYLVGSGQKRITTRSFEWFSLYEFSSPVPDTGAPKTMAQHGQGVAGTLYFSPQPDYAYTIKLDCVGLPIPLVDDSTVEAIPYLWTDAVAYFAAYLALLSAQLGVRTAEADKMFQRYQQFAQRARGAATPGVLPTDSPQIPSPVRANQLGASAQAGR